MTASTSSGQAASTRSAHSKSLPERPDLTNLRKQAKSLLKAHKTGDTSVCDVLRNVHRFSGKPDSEILAATLKLADVQFALAIDYGFGSWAEMKGFVDGATPATPNVHQRFWQGVVDEAEKGRDIGGAFREAASRITGTPLARAVEAVGKRVSSGEALWQAMDSYASEFTAVICMLCRAAEASERDWPAVAKRICEGVSNGVLGPGAPNGDHEQAAFWQVLGLCLSSGVPLLALLDLLKDSYLKSAELKTAVGDLRSAISGGGTIADAMAGHGDVFPPTVVSLIRDGERFGKLESMAATAGEWLRNGRYNIDEDVFYQQSWEYAITAGLLKWAIENTAKEVVIDSTGAKQHDPGPNSPAFRPKLILADGSQREYGMLFLANLMPSVERDLKSRTVLDSIQSGDELTGTLQMSLDGNDRLFRISYRSEDKGVIIRIRGEAGGDISQSVVAHNTKVPTDTADETIVSLIREAYQGRASDIHLQCVGGKLQSRFRIDGLLRQARPDMPQELGQAVVDQFKSLAKMDVSIRDREQLGRIMMDIDGKSLDLRVSVVPFVAGESVVIRLFDKATTSFSVEQLALSADNLAMLRRWISRPNGIVLAAGPTGSGMTTALYSILRELNDGERIIVTTEDPVEFVMPGIRQEQVDLSKGITFEHAIRSQLRQDPDVFMVSDIRSLDVAQLLVQTALTGHLAFSVLHTNDAPGALRRLLDMGLEPHLINSSIIGVFAQRLVRKICTNCAESYSPPDWLREQLGSFASSEYSHGKGCAECKGLGFRGRTAIHEFLEMNDPLRALVGKKAQADELRRTAIEAGMVTMRQDGLAKAAQGITTIEEIMRVTASDTKQSEERP